MEQQCKVLIVDDEALIRQGLKHYIDWEQEGFSIVGEASNGQEALELIAQLEPHIVITDIVMPLLDGEELTKIIKQDYPQIEIIILSSFGDFEYVRSTFQSGVADYILKPKLEGPELLMALRKIVHKIPYFNSSKKADSNSVDQHIEKLMSGFQVDIQPSILNKTFPYSHYCLLGIQIDKDKRMEYIEPLLKDALINMEYESYFIETDDFDFLVLLNCNESDFHIFYYNLHNLPASDSGPIWTASDYFTSIQTIKSIYEEQLLTMLQYQFYIPAKTLFIYNELPVTSEIKTEFNLKQFTDFFRARRFDEAFRYLEEHVQILSSQFTNDVHEFKSFLGNIIFNITTLLSNMDYESDRLDKEKYQYFTKIDHAKDVVQAIHILESFLIEVNTLIEMAEHGDEPNVRRLLEYINRHFAEPISLSSLAKHFHFNPSYLSTYFSTHMGVGFSEYLNKVRIQKSVELLQEKAIPISEISHLVGYSDHSYYCKVFKKMMGMSPSAYQKQIFT